MFWYVMQKRHVCLVCIVVFELFGQEFDVCKEFYVTCRGN